MNKISGILPTSHRIESVDMKAERAVRGGAVSIGQPTTRGTVRANAIQKETIGGLSDEILNSGLNKTGPKAEEKIVEDMSAAFFLKDMGGRELSANEAAVPADTSGQNPRLSIRV